MGCGPQCGGLSVYKSCAVIPFELESTCNHNLSLTKPLFLLVNFVSV